MAHSRVECLSCGLVRVAQTEPRSSLTGSCPRCGYVGWANASMLCEDDRRALREVPVWLRKLDNPLDRLSWR